MQQNAPKHKTDTSPICLQNLSLCRRGKTLLENISFDIHKGEIVTIIGPNGAGKSSLLKLILGLIKPSAGILTYPNGTRFGYMPQKITIPSSLPMTVENFLSLTKTDKQQLNSTLEQIKITHLAKIPLLDLSGGELQRVLLARSLLNNPDYLFLDEPVQGVDISGQTDFYELIGKIRSERGCGIAMVSHDLHLVMAKTDKVICLNQHICCHGHPEHVSKQPEFLELFGETKTANIAVYTHHHDHKHTQ